MRQELRARSTGDKIRHQTGIEAHLGIGRAEAKAGAMLVACRLAGLSALEGHFAGVKVCAQFGGAWLRGSFLLGVGERGRPPPLPSQTSASLNASSSLSLKSRKLAGNSRRGDDGVVTSGGNPYRRVRAGP